MPKNERHQKLKKDFQTWSANYLITYCHSYKTCESYASEHGVFEIFESFASEGGAFDSNGNIVHKNYKKKLKKAKNSGVYTRVKRADTSVAESFYTWDLIYLETPQKRGPAWKPNIRLLKQKYKQKSALVPDISGKPVFFRF